MTARPPNEPSRWLAKSIALPIGVVKSAMYEPIVTGSLLYILTRGPPYFRERLLQPFQNNLLSKNGAARLASAVAVLKVLTSLGILKRINRALNRLALNNWSFGRRGAPFKFGLAKEELVLITGGSSGFGYEMVKAFSKHARVIALDISPFPDELAKLPGVHYYRCDITDTPAVESLCEEIRKTHGNPTVLVNNAGIAVAKTVLETTNEECKKLFEVNLISHFTLIREFLPGMLEMKKGHIVTVASMASFFAAAGLLDYCCSKVAALYLNDGIRAECLTRYPGGEGICTTSVHPSWHNTGIIKGMEERLNQHGIYPEPATNVSEVVVEQVLKGRSGRLYIPSGEVSKTGLRNWPVWLQDIIFGHVWEKEKTFGFGKDKVSQLERS